MTEPQHAVTVPGAVVVLPPRNGRSRAVGPDGQDIDARASTTSGLQEAIDYAVGGGFDVHVVGGVEPGKGGPVIYTCDTTVRIPPVQGFTLTTGSVTLYFTPKVGSGPGLEFDSAMMLSFHLRGQVYYEGKGPAVRLAPREQLPLDPETVVTDSHVRFGAVAVRGRPSAVCVVFDAAEGAIVYNTFEFDEINGGARGIVVATPGLEKAFARNRVTCMHVHDQTEVCIQAGWEPTQAVFANYWLVDTTVRPPGRCIETFGRDSTWQVSIGDVLGVPEEALVLGRSAAGNLFQASRFCGRVVNETAEKANRFCIPGCGRCDA